MLSEMVMMMSEMRILMSEMRIKDERKAGRKDGRQKSTEGTKEG
jgi:hypothetical protein